MWIFIDLCVSTDWGVFLEWWPRDIDMQIFINLCVSQCLEVFLSCDIEVYLCIYLYKYRGKQIVGAKPRFFLSGGLDSVLLIVGVCVCFGVVTSICIYIYKCVVLFELFCSGLVTSMYLCIYIYIYICVLYCLEFCFGVVTSRYIYIYIYMCFWSGDLCFLSSFLVLGSGDLEVSIYIYTHIYIYIYMFYWLVFCFCFWSDDIEVSLGIYVYVHVFNVWSVCFVLEWWHRCIYMCIYIYIYTYICITRF